jgi:hypothetical protein
MQSSMSPEVLEEREDKRRVNEGIVKLVVFRGEKRGLINESFVFCWETWGSLMETLKVSRCLEGEFAGGIAR